MGLTEDVVARATSLRLPAVPGAAVAVAKATLLDTLGVAIAGRRERVVRIAEEFAIHDSPSEASIIWGSRARTSTSRAAFVNGTAAHALDYDDVCWAMNAHPSAVLWPAALAAGEAVDATGADVLVSYVAGFEAAADLGTVLGSAHYAAGFHPTATIGSIAATITAGTLFGLDGSALRRAVGIACSRAAGSRINFGTDTKPLHAGFAAETGIVAATLARLGATAREDAVEGPMGLAALYRGDVPETTRSGVALVEPGVEMKPYPSCRFTHRIIDATLAIRARRPGETPASIECVVDPFALSVVIYPRPRSGLEAKFSMEYSAAVAWLDGAVGIEAYADQRVSRKDVNELLARVTVRSGSKESESVRVTFPSGASDEEVVRFAKGSPSNPLSPLELHAKFDACALATLGNRVARLQETISRIELLKNISELSELLVAQESV